MSFGLSLLSMGMQMYGQVQQGKQQQQMFEYNAAVNRQQADMIKQSGALKVEQMRRSKSRMASSQVAAYAKAGVRMTGSPLQVVADTATELEMDIMIEDYNTRIGVINAQNQSDLNIMRGSQAMSSAYIGAGTTLLSQLPSFVGSRGSSPNIPTTSTYKQSNVSYGYANSGTYAV